MSRSSEASDGGWVRRKGSLGFRNCREEVEVGTHKLLGRRLNTFALGFGSPACLSAILQSSLKRLDGQTPGRALGPTGELQTPHWRVREAIMANF